MMTNRIASLIFVLFATLVASVAGGCRAQHLGPRQGEAYRKAFGRQLANKSRAPANQDAADAERVLGAHRSGGQTSAAPPALPPLSLTGGR
jgi:hypothetical protein